MPTILRPADCEKTKDDASNATSKILLVLYTQQIILSSDFPTREIVQNTEFWQGSFSKMTYWAKSPILPILDKQNNHISSPLIFHLPFSLLDVDGIAAGEAGG
jgi:hypothetical protein